MSLHQEIIDAISEIRDICGGVTFTWMEDNNSYPCIASVSEFKNDLVEGGFTISKMVTMTVPLYDSDGNSTFTNDVIPKSQQKITLLGDLFRIESVKKDAVINDAGQSARIRIFGVGTSRGI